MRCSGNKFPKQPLSCRPAHPHTGPVKNSGRRASASGAALICFVRVAGRTIGLPSDAAYCVEWESFPTNTSGPDGLPIGDPPSGSRLTARVVLRRSSGG